jgi:hypothetical protein
MNSRIVLFALCAWGSLEAHAGPASAIYSPTVIAGEREIDFKFGQTDAVAGTRAQAGSIGFGYGMRENWFTEIYLKREREGSEDATLAEFENRFQLTETGKYAVDVGLLSEIEIPLHGTAAKEIKLGPLLQTEIGKLQLNGNMLLEHVFGQADESGAPYATTLNYQLQAKYRWRRVFEFGVQTFGALGKWDDWSQQQQQGKNVGPAVFGKVSLGGRQALQYNAAWLFRANEVAPAHTFRAQIEYEY